MESKVIAMLVLVLMVGGTFWMNSDQRQTPASENSLSQPKDDLVKAATTSKAVTLNCSLPKAEGMLHVGIFSSDRGFPKPERTFRSLQIPVSGEQARVELDELAPGTYAIAVFQDVNENGKMDRSGFGIPTEPYGFSNNARGRMGPPAFDKAAFELAELPVTLDIRVK